MPTARTLDRPTRITMNATLGKLTELECPEGTRSVICLYRTAADDGDVDGYVACEGTEGNAIGAAFLTIDGVVLRRVPIRQVDEQAPAFSLFVASSVNDGIGEFFPSSVST